MRIPIIVLTILLAGTFLAVAVPKLTGQPQMRDRMAKLGFSAGTTRLLGVLELAAVAGLVIGLFWMPLGVAAALGVTLQLAAAVGLHIRAKDPGPVVLVPLVFAGAAAALAVLHLVNG